MDTKKLFMLLLILIGLMFLVSQEVIAECPDGKMDITVTNPGGKVIELCVPEQVVDKIGGPQDIVVLDVCPCWSPSDLDYYAKEWVQTNPEEEYQCTSTGDESSYKNPSSNDISIGTGWVEDFKGGGWMGTCAVRISQLDIFQPGTINMTRSQFEACQLSLLNSDFWAMYCGE